jgi:hypothetical protein
MAAVVAERKPRSATHAAAAQQRRTQQQQQQQQRSTNLMLRIRRCDAKRAQ